MRLQEALTRPFEYHKFNNGPYYEISYLQIKHSFNFQMRMCCLGCLLFSVLIVLFNILLILLFDDDLNRRGCSSNGRALALHARGTGFDPPHLHHSFELF